MYLAGQTGGELIELYLLYAKAVFLDRGPDVAEQTMDGLFRGTGAADEVAIEIAIVYDSLDEYETSLDWLWQVPESERPALFEIQLLRKLRRADEAVDACHEALHHDPENPELMLELAQLLFRRAWGIGATTSGDAAEKERLRKEAESWAERAERAERVFADEANRAKALLLLGQIAADRGQIAEARELSRRARAITASERSSPDTPEVPRVRLRGGYFENVRRLENVNSPHHDVSPSVTADGLILVFHSERRGPSLWLATRRSTEEEFGPPRPLEEVNSRFPHVGHISISPDGLSIYVYAGPRVDLDSYLATRPSREDFDGSPMPFGEPVLLEALQSDQNDSEPEWTPRCGRRGLQSLGRDLEVANPANPYTIATDRPAAILRSARGRVPSGLTVDR